MQSVFFATIPVFTLSMLVEFWLVHRRQRGAYEAVDTRTNLSMGLISLATGLAGDALLIISVTALNGVVPWAVPETAWWSLPLAVVAVDFALYWSHRTHHEVRFFWAAHVNHHSSRHYNLSVALRQSWTEHYTGMPFYIALGALGFSANLILFAFAINLIFQFFTHTEQVGRLWRPIEWVFNTPSHHRVHHATNVEYLDRNYGGIFIIWDRLFGTFQAEEEAPVYGLRTNLETHALWTVAMHEWAALFTSVKGAKGWRRRLQYALQPPGWSPDGTTLTSAQIKRAHHVRHTQVIAALEPAQSAAPAPLRGDDPPHLGRRDSGAARRRHHRIQHQPGG